MSETDGGPAFPVMEPLEKYNNDAGKYITVYQPTGGMSLRDYFAAKALPQVLALNHERGFFHPNTNAREAYELADAMLEARKK